MRPNSECGSGEAMRQFARPPKVILLDRDGVINRRIPGGYVTVWEQFVFLPGVLHALKRLAEEDLKVIVVSNQAGVGKGLLGEAALADITRQFVRPVEESGGKIHAVYYCPHRPDDGCQCRKPGPGLLLQAQRDHGFEFRDAVMVGDAESDVVAAHRVGCTSILIGDEDPSASRTRRHAPDWIFRDLREAVAFILGPGRACAEAMSAG
jgi:D-glycero-D-manno-heptose 1,7-bisphosphate phosphatase